MTGDAQFPQHPGTGERPPLTRKEMREREREAQQASRKKSNSKHPVETPAAPVLADLFTAHSSSELEAAQPRAAETAVLPSRRSLRNRQPGAAVPPVPLAETAVSAPVVSPAATPSAPTVSERLFTAPVATVGGPVTETAPDSADTRVRADQPLNLFGITPTTGVAPVRENAEGSPAAAATASAAAPVAVSEEAPATRKRSKPAKKSGAVRASKRAVATTAPRSRKKASSTVKSKRVWVSRKALAPSSSSSSGRKRSASKALSLVAMLFAFPIVVGVSVPSNVFLDADSAVTAAGVPAADVAALSASPRATQSLAVSDEVQSEVAAHDDLSVISYAEVLALKYAGVDYEYNATTGAVRWPFPYSVPITDGFGDRIGGFHKGTDFAAPSGTPIYAIADGTVELIQADWSGYGYHAVISHTINGQQVTSLYAHMITDSSPIEVGQEIKAGDFIGLVGETGIAYGAHLHFEIHLDDVPVDPFAWLTANAVD